MASCFYVDIHTQFTPLYFHLYQMILAPLLKESVYGLLMDCTSVFLARLVIRSYYRI